MKMKSLYLLPALFLALLNCSNTTPENSEKEPTWPTAEELNKRLGRGMNIGNTFEALASWQTPFDPQDLKRIADLRFDHVRIPIRWERDDRSAASAPYAIHPSFMTTIEEVVDEALKNKLHVVINMHHHDALYADPAGQKARFLSQWRQIADHFKEYPDSLLFEIMNEPHDKLTAELWNDYSKEALGMIRKTNPSRGVLLGVAEWGGVGALKKLHIPEDDNLILTIHYYSPFEFTHQGAEWSEGSDAWLGTRWNDTEYERQAVRDDFSFAIQLAKENGIPIHVGEFGAFSRADMESRIKWTRYLSRWFEQQGFSWAYWEWRLGFGIYDPHTDTYRQGLVDALLKDPVPEAFTPPSRVIYTSDFSQHADGWQLYNNDASAKSSMTVSGGKVNIAITQPGKEGWHIQLIKGGFAIEQGKRYMVRFKASTANSDAKNISINVSKAESPWTSYGAKSCTLNKSDTQYTLFFVASHSDSAARLVFSVGNEVTSGVTLHSIEWLEVDL